MHSKQDRMDALNLRDMFVAELTLLYQYKHPNICTLMAHAIDGPTRCLVYEFCVNGSVYDRIRCKTVTTATPSTPRANDPLSMIQRLRIAVGTDALLYSYSTP
jgi:hypothetical protein